MPLKKKYLKELLDYVGNEITNAQFDIRELANSENQVCLLGHLLLKHGFGEIKPLLAKSSDGGGPLWKFLFSGYWSKIEEIHPNLQRAWALYRVSLVLKMKPQERQTFDIRQTSELGYYIDDSWEIAASIWVKENQEDFNKFISLNPQYTL